MASRFSEEIDGEGVTWAVAGFVASLLIGVAIEPFRGTVGLENVALGYLLVVVVAAAVGGRVAGLISALSAALSYDFFLATPYHSLRIDSVAQVITVALLFGTGLVASLAGRARRRLTVETDTQAGIIRLLNTITRAAAAGESSDRLAAEGIHTLLDARRVVIRRGDPDHEVVTGAVDLPRHEAEPGKPLGVEELRALQMRLEVRVLDLNARDLGRSAQDAVAQARVEVRERALERAGHVGDAEADGRMNLVDAPSPRR